MLGRLGQFDGVAGNAIILPLCPKHANHSNAYCLWRQCWRVVLQVFDQHERHRDVRRERDVAVDGDISQLVQHQRQVIIISLNKRRKVIELQHLFIR